MSWIAVLLFVSLVQISDGVLLTWHDQEHSVLVLHCRMDTNTRRDTQG